MGLRIYETKGWGVECLHEACVPKPGGSLWAWTLHLKWAFPTMGGVVWDLEFRI